MEVRRVAVQRGAVTLAVYDWPADAGANAPVVVLSHGTGFHGRCWDAVVERMPRGVRCIALDHRGAGLSEKPAPSSRPWSDGWTDVDQCYYAYPQFGQDTMDVMDALGIAPRESHSHIAFTNWHSTPRPPSSHMSMPHPHHKPQTPRSESGTAPAQPP
jgi:pimeloyl-ACP methyl ester carboxylesterase